MFVAPERRAVGMVFQDYALFPHLDVAANVGFGLPRRGRPGRVRELLALVGLEGMGERSPGELSGGQQQRVALARALAPSPSSCCSTSRGAPSTRSCARRCARSSRACCASRG